jgi:hypothetical protein
MSWQEMKELLHERLQANAKNGKLNKRQYNDATRQILWSLEFDFGARGTHEFAQWENEFLTEQNGEWVLR